MRRTYYLHSTETSDHMSKSVLDNLFGSRARVKILKFIFRTHPEHFTFRDVVQRTQESEEVVKKELSTLESMHLVRRISNGS